MALRRRRTNKVTILPLCARVDADRNENEFLEWRTSLATKRQGKINNTDWHTCARFRRTPWERENRNKNGNVWRTGQGGLRRRSHGHRIALEARYMCCITVRSFTIADARKVRDYSVPFKCVRWAKPRKQAVRPEGSRQSTDGWRSTSLMGFTLMIAPRLLKNAKNEMTKPLVRRKGEVRSTTVSLRICIFA